VQGQPASLLAYPMHGQRKLLSEGYRTRDGHFIEWFGRRAPGRGVKVVSRPEPRLLTRPLPADRAIAAGTHSVETATWRLPDPRDRRRWWQRSAAAYPTIPASQADSPAVVWNPFVATAPTPANPFAGKRIVVLDLLDDWSFHYAFASIRDEVEAAYAAAFANATHVTANGAGTADLARRFGRDDVILLPNGCDPERYSTTSTATGPLTIGYVGKIGRRLDLEGIVDTVTALPEASFVFAGPILDAEYRPVLESLANVTLLGDVHYDDVPALLQTFDIGWVPHHVGEREVGGDVIKSYEYRAAGLPVLSTPVSGMTERGLDHVAALPMADHVAWLVAQLQAGPRVSRRVSPLPASTTWESKAATLLDLLGLDDFTTANGVAA
jgi:glycosyltransferase involved in cell wall biosynthesis